MSSEFFVLAVVTLSYPLMLLRVFSLLQRPKKEPSTKQLEQKLLACHQEILGKIERQARTDVKAALGKIEEALGGQLASFSGQYSKILSKLEKTVQNDCEKNRQDLKTMTDKYLGETKIALSGLIEAAAKRVDDELTKQLQGTRTELEDYKKQQIEKIDNEIATLVEKTIYRTLGKGLSLKDQIDIIYESLAEAKEESFFERDVS